MSGATGSAGHEKDRAWRVFAVFAIPVVSSWMKLRIIDGHKMPKTGSFVLAPNHNTNIDPVVVGLAMWRLGRVPRFLAKASLFRVPVFGSLMRALGHVPVERTGRGGNPLAVAAKLAERGHAVLIYPEGTLTREPELWPMRGKTGAVRVALEQGVPIVPAAHWGSQALLPRYSTRFRPFPRKRIDVIIGDAVDLSPWRGRPLDAATLAEATDAVMDAITALLEQLRGESAPAERWDPAQHGQTEYGRPDQPPV